MFTKKETKGMEREKKEQKDIRVNSISREEERGHVHVSFQEAFHQ